MNVLALDTCFGAVSAAVRWQSARGEWLMRESYEERETGLAERLLPMVAEVMEAARVDFSAIDRIAVTVGPGSFTGARVGVAAARALGLAAERPVVGITSLEVMAARARLQLAERRRGRPVLVAVDARRNGLYCGLYDGDTGAETLAPTLFDADAAARAVSALSEVVVVGSGAAVVAECAARGAEVEAALPRLQPHARFLLQLALDRDPAGTVEPLYLRAPDAKPPTSGPIPRAPA